MEKLLEILLIGALIILGVFLFLYIRKINKEIKELDRKKRKRDKELLKLTSKRKNKTY
jgi:large-conductance mechanosensitive channel